MTAMQADGIRSHGGSGRDEGSGHSGLGHDVGPRIGTNFRNQQDTDDLRSAERGSQGLFCRGYTQSEASTASERHLTKK